MLLKTIMNGRYAIILRMNTDSSNTSPMTNAMMGSAKKKRIEEIINIMIDSIEVDLSKMLTPIFGVS
tara:strand:+ start:1041 stop:1241 length:201 start_codon:yes stop_codon:yes gene_type:complete